ncbi:hypothetical protein AB0P17_36375 [Streptomyces sp. NPDC088124]|uniref:hypothetical protein n=1 Tax=Streptomyces sp. NPDC088124 TaxID=3154654 RepID=UPI0034126F52
MRSSIAHTGPPPGEIPTGPDDTPTAKTPPLPRRTHRLTVKARHEDQSLCEHRVTSSGKPTEAGCTGRHDYVATCSCGGWTQTGSPRTALQYSHATHRNKEAARA